MSKRLTVVDRINHGIGGVCRGLLYVTTGAIFFILCANVILRYTVGSSLRWAAEVPEMLFPWMIMAGVVLAAQHGAHIATTFVADLAPGRTRVLLSAAGHVVLIAAYSVLSVVTVRLIPIVADERSPILQIPGSVTYACVLAGFAAIALAHLGALLGLLAHIRTGPVVVAPLEAGRESYR